MEEHICTDSQMAVRLRDILNKYEIPCIIHGKTVVTTRRKDHDIPY